MNKAALMAVREKLGPSRAHFKGCRELAEELPCWEHWRRKYVSPKGYWNWSEAAAAYVSQSSSIAAEIALRTEDEVAIFASSVSMAAISLDAPAIFVGEQMLQALNQTDPPKLEEPPNDVWPAVFVMLPRGHVIGTGGETISSMLVITMRTFEQFNREQNEKPLWDPGIDGVLVVSISEEGVMSYSHERWDASPDTEYRHIPNHQWVPEPDDDLRKIGHIRFAKNLLLLKNAKPELITTEARPSTHGVGFGRSPHRRQAALPITWLGKNFVLEREHRSSGDGSGRGPVRPHWRRGHWTTVAYGKGKTLRRQRWIQPIHVNLHKEQG